MFKFLQEDTQRRRQKQALREYSNQVAVLEDSQIASQATYNSKRLVEEKTLKQLEASICCIAQEYGFEAASHNSRMSEEGLLALLYHLGFFRDVCKRDEELYCQMI